VTHQFAEQIDAAGYAGDAVSLAKRQLAEPQTC